MPPSPATPTRPADEAFFRMFERDKTELRELGVPLETGRNSGFDTADGYRIARHDYELGEIDLEPDEAAAVALAARLWDTPELAGAAHGALVKLRAAGVEVDETGGPVQPRVRATEPAFAPLLAAVQAGRVVTFDAPPRRPDRRGQPAHRRAVGGGVRRGAAGTWSGHDRDRADVRSFRLSRIAGPVTPIGPPGAVQVPAGVDLLAVVERGVGAPPVIGTARLWVAAGRAHGLRRLGRRRSAARRTAGDELEIDLRSLDTVARWVAGYGPDVVVLHPPELAAAVRRAWAGAAAAHARRPRRRFPDRRGGAGWREAVR